MSLSVVLFEDKSPEKGYKIQWDSSFGGVLDWLWSCFEVVLECSNRVGFLVEVEV